MKYGWRLLLAIPRMSERYHALAQIHRNNEHVFRHARERYALFGNDQTGKLKRFGLGAQRLRLAVARFLEWFRICLRHGWIGKHKRLNKRLPVTRRGDRRLRAMLLARLYRGLNLPYGPAAFVLGLAPDDQPPPKVERQKRRHRPAKKLKSG